MYAVAITQLIHQLEDDGIKQTWYADDAKAGESLNCLKAWWDHIVELGPNYGYFPNAVKTWLIVKKKTPGRIQGQIQRLKNINHNRWQDILEPLLVHPNLSLAIYIQHKVTEWVNEIEHLSAIATAQPHAAYAAPNIDDQLRPLEDVIKHKFLPSLTGQTKLSDETRDLMALPLRLGDLGIINPTRNNTSHHQSSKNITQSLTAQIRCKRINNSIYR